ncbi:MAG: PAS domain-containing protein, partial [Alkalinema sp. RL_2_19]|nr:PAS domain-containing protein [Alkalinema sp. RL_2_19]
ISAEQRVQAVFAESSQVTVLLSPTGQVLDLNQTSLHLLGQSGAALRHQPFWALPWWSAGGDRDRLAQMVAAVAAGATRQLEVTVCDAAGTPIGFELHLRPVQDATGRVILLVAEGRDLTQLRRVEATLQFQQDFDRLIANLSMRFLHLTPDQADTIVMEALQQIGQFLNVDTVHIIRLHDQRQTLTMSHEWVQLEGTNQATQFTGDRAPKFALESEPTATW